MLGFALGFGTGMIFYPILRALWNRLYKKAAKEK